MRRTLIRWPPRMPRQATSKRRWSGSRRLWGSLRQIRRAGATWSEVSLRPAWTCIVSGNRFAPSKLSKGETNMTLHETWVAAKKQAWKEFKEAQKNYLKAQDKKINETNDAKAKKKALDMVLGEAGLDKGESLDDYLKFADGFGKQLDTLENA